MGAKVSVDISFTWRSVLKDKELLKQGLRWRIGSGEQMMVFKDPWLKTHYFEVLINNIFLRPSLRV